jgi:hypothetical protein
MHSKRMEKVNATEAQQVRYFTSRDSLGYIKWVVVRVISNWENTSNTGIPIMLERLLAAQAKKLNQPPQIVPPNMPPGHMNQGFAPSSGPNYGGFGNAHSGGGYPMGSGYGGR